MGRERCSNLHTYPFDIFIPMAFTKSHSHMMDDFVGHNFKMMNIVKSCQRIETNLDF